MNIGENTLEPVMFAERKVILVNMQWSRDWEQFNQSYIGRSEAGKLSDDELIEYLRWLACNKPGKYAIVMTAFAKTQDRIAGIAV